MSQALHILISPETLFTVGGYGVSNTLFTSILVTILFVSFVFVASRNFKKTSSPRGVQNVLEMVVEMIVGIIEGVTGKSKLTDAIYPLISAFLVFIMINNLVALLPGFHTIEYTGHAKFEIANVPSWLKVPTAFAASAPAAADPEAHGVPATEAVATKPTAAHAAEPAEEKAVSVFRGADADLSLTLALATISVVATQYFGLRFAHLAYLKKFFNFSNPINAFVGILELFLEFSKIMSFGFRLFGNIFAGEVLISVIKFLVPIILPIPFLGIEVFVGCLQAYVFAMLSLVFFQMAATSEHH